MQIQSQLLLLQEQDDAHIQRMKAQIEGELHVKSKNDGKIQIEEEEQKLSYTSDVKD